jgi:hypothetical protein
VGVWSQAVDCVDAFDMNHTSVTVKMSSHLFYFIKKFYRSVLSIRFKKKCFNKLCYCSIHKKETLILPTLSDHTKSVLKIFEE